MYLDIVLCVLLLFAMFLGWRRGFLRGIIGLVANIVSIVAAIFSAKPISKLFDKWFGLTEELSDLINGNGKFLSILISGVIVFVVVRLLFLVISRFIKSIKEQSKVINTLDSVLGIFLGAIKYLLVICIIFLALYLLAAIPFVDRAIDWLFEKSVVSKFFYEFIVDTIVPLFGNISAGSLFN